MAEGDTIHKAAARLGPALVGAALVRFRAPRLVGRGPLPGATIDAVEAEGKNLLIHFSGGLSLRTHLRMSGAWHLYLAGEAWRKPTHLARVVIEVDTGCVAVCFSAPVVETYHRDLRRPAALDALGPDLCLPASLADEVLDVVLARIDRFTDASTELGVALLDQRIAAGIGNVFKSEICFAERVDPFTPIGDLDTGTRRRLWTTAARQLQANLHTRRRTTHARGLAVYKRGGRPCHTCGTPIRWARQGAQQRSTYWCPVCQPRPGPG